MHIFDQSKYFFLHSAWSRAFFVTLFFVTLATSLFWLDFFRGYRAEVTLLIVPKAGAPMVTFSAPENLAELARTLSFYERVLAENDLIDDAFEGYAPDKRKALWNELVSVESRDGSGVLMVRALGDTPEAAALLARQTARTLFAVAGFYYDVKTDIDMRIVDGPIVAYALARPITFALTSVFSGLTVTSLFFLLLYAVPGFIGKRQERKVVKDENVVAENRYREFALGESVPWIDPRKFIPAKPTTLSFEHPTEQTKRAIAPRTSGGTTVSAPAPANLPIADEVALPVADEEALPFTFEAMPEEVETSLAASESESSEAPPIFPVRGEHFTQPASTLSYRGEAAQQAPRAETKPGEPTIDEYKRRLNELLSGGK